MKKVIRNWYWPDPFEIAVILTFFVILLTTLLTDFSVHESVVAWGQGLWSLIGFMTQMSLILLGGYVLALSRPIKKVLRGLAQLPESDSQAYLLCLFVSAFSCWLNWGLGLVTGAFFCLQLARIRPQLNFPLLVSISYMGFIFWHAGLSGSIPLTVGTPGNFSEKWVGRVIGVDQTIFSFFNLGLIVVLFLALGGLVLYLEQKSKGPTVEIEPEYDFPDGEVPSVFSQAVLWGLILLIGFFLGSEILSGEFKLGLNQLNLILFFLSLLTYRNLRNYFNAAGEACSKLAPILIQYPLYAGIMAIMIESGLAVKISNGFVSISSEWTYPLYMFLSAGLVNFFVPSGGGQWAVQASVVMDGARQLNLPLEKSIMAVAWGDAWTNLAQPFWALPLLSIVGLSLRDIFLYCLYALGVSGFVISSWFLIF